MGHPLYMHLDTPPIGYCSFVLTQLFKPKPNPDQYFFYAYLLNEDYNITAQVH